MFDVSIKTRTKAVCGEVDTLKDVAGLLLASVRSRSTIGTILRAVRKSGYCEWKAGSLRVAINKPPGFVGSKKMTLADCEDRAYAQEGEEWLIAM